MRKNTVFAVSTVCALGAASAIPLPRFLFPHHAHDEIGSWFQDLLAQDEADMALAAEEQADYIPHTHIQHAGEAPDAPSEHDVLSHVLGYADQHDEAAKVVETAKVVPSQHHEDHDWTHSHAGHGFDASSDYMDAIHKAHATHHNEHVAVPDRKTAVSPTGGHVETKEAAKAHRHEIDSPAFEVHHAYDHDLLGHREAHMSYDHHVGLSPYEGHAHHYVHHSRDPLSWMGDRQERDILHGGANVPAQSYYDIHQHDHMMSSPYAAPEHGYFEHGYSEHGYPEHEYLDHGHHDHGHHDHDHVSLTNDHDRDEHARHEASFAHQHLRSINSAFKHNFPQDHSIHDSTMGGLHDPLVGKTLFDVMLDASALPV